MKPMLVSKANQL